MSWWNFAYGGYDDYTPTTDYTAGADYSLGAGTDLGGGGLQLPDSYGGGSGYDLSSGVQSGGGLQLPVNWSYDTSYGISGSSPSSSGGGFSVGLPTGGAQGNVPTYAGGEAPRFSLGTWSPSIVGSAPGVSAAGGLQLGSGATGLQPGGGAGLKAPTIQSAPSQGGLTGSFGGVNGNAMGTPEWSREVNTLSNARMAREGRNAYSNDAGPGLVERASGALGALEQWGKENPRLASAIGQGVGALASYAGQRRASKLAEQQLALQGQAQQSQIDAATKNNATADYWNAQSRQSGDEARSLYNPQELAVRSMAQQQARTNKAVAGLDKLSAKGWSAGDIASEKRRAKLQGSTNATTGYMAGLDAGRSAQSGALSSAKALSAPYSGISAQPSFAGATYYADQGQQAGDQLKALLERYMGRPQDALDEQDRAARQSGSLQ